MIRNNSGCPFVGEVTPGVPNPLVRDCGLVFGLPVAFRSMLTRLWLAASYSTLRGGQLGGLLSPEVQVGQVIAGVRRGRNCGDAPVDTDCRP